MGKKSEQGQVLLIVILVLVITLTVGLSAASRSITNLRLSEEEAASKRALAAAEAGIEQALSASVPIAGSFSNNDATYDTQVVEIKGTRFLMFGGNPLSKDEGGTLWLSDYSEDSAKLYGNPWSGQVTLYWGEALDECSNAALEIMVIEGPKTDPKITRYAYDPCTRRRAQNNFSPPATPGITIQGIALPYKVPSIVANSGIILRIIPLYKDTVVGADGNKALPSQGFLITSLGKAGTTKKKVTVFKEYPQLTAGFFSHSLFSP